MEAYAWACEGVGVGYLFAYILFILLTLISPQLETLRPALLLVKISGIMAVIACSFSIRLMAKRPEPSRASTEE